MFLPQARESDDDTDSILSSHLSEFGSPCFNHATPLSVSQSGYEITPDGKAESIQVKPRTLDLTRLELLFLLLGTFMGNLIFSLNYM